MGLEKFEQLSAKVDALISLVDELTRQKLELSRLLEQKDEELKAAHAKAEGFEQERAQVAAKVDELLVRIEQHVAH